MDRAEWVTMRRARVLREIGAGGLAGATMAQRDAAAAAWRSCPYCGESSGHRVQTDAGAMGDCAGSIAEGDAQRDAVLGARRFFWSALRSGNPAPVYRPQEH